MYLYYVLLRMKKTLLQCPSKNGRNATILHELFIQELIFLVVTKNLDVRFYASINHEMPIIGIVNNKNLVSSMHTGY